MSWRDFYSAPTPSQYGKLTPTVKCFASVPAPELPEIDGRIQHKECGFCVPIPNAADLTRSGFPQVTHTINCPNCGAFVCTVTDFGRCDGIRTVKKFPSVLAAQKRSVTAMRKLGVAS